MIEFRLLGPLEIETPDGPVPLGGARQRALLTILLLDAGRVVPTERLVDLLWGEEAPKTATTSLQNAVSALRKLLGPERIETRAPGYVLRVDPETVDVQRFERLVTQCHKAPPAERRSAFLDD
ncbi:MAG TPA: winged helix-turn-helix domain-containing protein [Gaiellaceae bacterium]